MKFTVVREGTLLPFLFASMPDKSRTTVKSFLTHRQVSVNGCITTRFDHPLAPGDAVNISGSKGPEAFRHQMMRIVYEDDHLIVIDKRSGLLSIGTDKEQRRTAFYILSDYVKRQNPSARIFVIHRLDRETSGLMMFARSQEVQETVQRSWKRLVTDRRYVAVVEGSALSAEGEITSFLTEDKNRKVWASARGEGEQATTFYKTVRQGNRHALIDLKLETGKKNQIRAHMEWKGCPIAGDKKYGAKTDPAGRVCLHAYRLCFTHPVTGESMEFATPVPRDFTNNVN